MATTARLTINLLLKRRQSGKVSTYNALADLATVIPNDKELATDMMGSYSFFAGVLSAPSGASTPLRSASPTRKADSSLATPLPRRLSKATVSYTHLTLPTKRIV